MDFFIVNQTNQIQFWKQVNNSCRFATIFIDGDTVPEITPSPVLKYKFEG